MARRASAVSLAIFLIFMCTRAFGDVAYYKGDLEVLETSGALCAQKGTYTLHVELVLKDGASAGEISGFARAIEGTIGRFSGGSLDRLALSFPYFNNPNAEGHTLGLLLNGDRITGELREKHLEASFQDCSIDRGKLQLMRIATGPEAEKYLDTLSVGFDAAKLENEARYYWDAGRYVDAERPLKQVIGMREAMLGKDAPGVAVNLNYLAKLYMTMGRYTEAEPLYARTLEIRESQLGRDHPDVATSLENLAWLYETVGRYSEAEPLYVRALEIREAQLGSDHPDVATSLNGLGELYVTTGRYSEAEPLLKRAVQIQESKLGKDHLNLTASLDNLAWLYETVGRYSEAEPLFRRALEIGESKLGKDHPDVTTNMNNLAELYETMGRYSEAEALLKHALEIWESKLGKDHPDLAAMLDNLAWLYRTTDRYSEALALYKRALEISESKLGKDHPDLSPTMNNLAELYTTMGLYSQAEALLRRSLAIWESKLGRDHPDVVSSLCNLAELYITTGRYPEAEAFLRRALPIAQINMVPASIWAVQEDYSLLFARLGHREAAIFFGKQAVNTVQSLRQNVAKINKETLQTYQRTVEFVYKHLSDLLIEAGRLAEAQQVIDLLKQEEYFDYVQRDAKDTEILAGRATLTSQEAPLEARYREQAVSLAKLSVERGGLYSKERRTPDEEAKLARLDKDLENAGAAFQKVIDQIDKELSEKRQDKVEQIKEAQGLQEDLRELGQGTVALYTLMGEDKYHLLLIAPDLRMAYEYPISASELNRKIQAFRLVLRNPNADPRPLAKELYTILFGPAAADLRGLNARTLMWSLDGALRYLPVSALYDGNAYLIENYRSVIFTPASQARLKDQPKSAWKVLGLGVSKALEGFVPLPGVREELAEIIRVADSPRGVLPGIVDLDEGFTLEAMKDGLRQRYPVVHIASHFQFTPGDDAKSYLLLGDGSFLTLNEVKTQNSLFGGVDLLTLSACNTGIGDGKEVEGFGVLAQRQGAKGVIATLWPVADESTGLLMLNFYRMREQDRLTKAEALQRVQQMFIKGQQQMVQQNTTRGIRVPVQHAEQPTDAPELTPDPDAPYSHPYYWAPFILIGNWL